MLFLLSGTILAATLAAGIRDWLGSRRRKSTHVRHAAACLDRIEDLEKSEVSLRVREYFIYWAARRGIPPRVNLDAYLSAAYDVDADSLEDMIIDLLKATGRSLHRLQDNPYYGRVRTLSNLTHFILFQPEAR